jgi:hypothetical protein
LKQKNFNSYQILEPVLTLQSQNTDIKYQNFTYCLVNRNRKVKYVNQVSIDFTKAVKELNDLDWTYKDNGISIFNLRNDQNIFCSRLKTDKWLVLTRVMKGGVYTGYQWASYPDHESLINTIRLFFEEVDWLASLHYDMIKWESDFSI